MKVLIGSRERLNFPVKKIFNDFVLFIEPQFFDEYKKEYPSIEIVKLKENNKGFGYLLNSMVDYTLENKEKYFLFTDDDIYGLKKKVGKKLIKIDSVDKFLEEGYIIIETLNLAQLGVSFQGHNWYWNNSLKMNTAVWGMGIINAEIIKKIGGYCEKIKLFNDYEITARLLSCGYQNACWYDYAFEHKMKSKKGGAEFLYAKNQIVNEAVFYLNQQYPCCSRIIKHEKHGIYEIRFNWKKLYGK